MKIYTIINSLLRTKGDIIKLRFNVGDRCYEAYVPDDQYWISIKDVLLNREYEYISLFNIESIRGFTVIDVGAHVGLYSLVVSGYADRVISVEPNPVNYMLLEINRIINNIDIEKMRTLNAAVISTKVDKVRLCEITHTADSSIMVNSSSNNSSRCYYVQTITLDELIKSHALDSKILLKIDIEGAEFEIFKLIDPRYIELVERIVMEVHLKYGSLDIIINKLRSAGFTVRYFYPPLVAKDAKPPLKVQNMLGLKLLRYMIYSLTKLSRLKDKDLVILFAWRE